jgi:hypothetical protein
MPTGSLHAGFIISLIACRGKTWLKSVLCKVLRQAIIDYRTGNEIFGDSLLVLKIAWSLGVFEVNLTNLERCKTPGSETIRFYALPVAMLHFEFLVSFGTEGVAIDVHCHCRNA